MRGGCVGVEGKRPPPHLLQGPHVVLPEEAADSLVEAAGGAAEAVLLLGAPAAGCPGSGSRRAPQQKQQQQQQGEEQPGVRRRRRCGHVGGGRRQGGSRHVSSAGGRAMWRGRARRGPSLLHPPAAAETGPRHLPRPCWGLPRSLCTGLGGREGTPAGPQRDPNGRRRWRGALAGPACQPPPAVPAKKVHANTVVRAKVPQTSHPAPARPSAASVSACCPVLVVIACKAKVCCSRLQLSVSSSLHLLRLCCFREAFCC